MTNTTGWAEEFAREFPSMKQGSTSDARDWVILADAEKLKAFITELLVTQKKEIREKVSEIYPATREIEDMVDRQDVLALLDESSSL